MEDQPWDPSDGIGVALKEPLCQISKEIGN